MSDDIWTEAIYRCDRDKHEHDRGRPCADSVRAVHEEAITELECPDCKLASNIDHSCSQSIARAQRKRA